MIRFHVGPDGHRLQVGHAGELRAAGGARMRVGEGWFVSPDMEGVFDFTAAVDEASHPVPAGRRAVGWDYVDGAIVRLTEAIAPKTLTAAQLDRFLRDDATLPPGALYALYEAAIPILEAQPTQIGRFAASVARRGEEFTFGETLALAQAVAAQQTPPVTLDAAALRAAWDAAALLALAPGPG